MKKEYFVELREEEADELMNDHWVGELVRCKDCRHYDPTFMFCNNLETHSVYAEFGCIEGEKFPEINT